MNHKGISGISLSTTALLIISILLSVIAGRYSTYAFEYSGYCEKMCKYGRGGNLCKCSAVHFAGKRQDEHAIDGGFGQQYRFPHNSNPMLSDQQQNHIEDIVARNHVDENENGNWVYDASRPGQLSRALERNGMTKQTLRGYLGRIRRRRQAPREYVN